MTEAPIIIAGAGPCGIGTALTLARDYPAAPFLLIDPRTKAGGNAASTITPEGFVFDYGGHVLFVHDKYPEFAALLTSLDIAWSRSLPIRCVHMFGRLIPTPIQRNIHRLPAREALPILGDLLLDRLGKAMGRSPPPADGGAQGSFADHLARSFGLEMTRRVMAPLNRKMWTLDPAEMNSDWVRQRSGSALHNVPDIRLRRLLSHALRRMDDPGWSGVAPVTYPARGGTGAIWTRALDAVDPRHLRLGRRINAIMTDRRELSLDDGTTIPFAALISSMPLDTLLTLCVDRPDLQAMAGRLRRSSALLLGFGVRGTVPARYRGIHSLQCPEPDLPFWRVTIPSNFSPGNVPDPAAHYSILCEVSRAPGVPAVIDDMLRRRVREGLRTIGLIDDQPVISTFETALVHGYPLPFLGRDALLAEIHAELHPLGIYSRGRFGGWRYEASNMDHAYMQGVEAARRVTTGASETTYFRPEEVN